MMSNTTTIGLHKIIAPSKEQLTLVDGQELAAKYVEPLTEAIIAGTAQIAFLIPEGRPLRQDGMMGMTIIPDFYVGLFEELFKQTRDHLFPELRSQAARDRIRPVGGAEHVQPEFKDVVRDIVDAPRFSYSVLEKFMQDKIYIGFSHSDGSHTLAVFDDERIMEDTDLSQDSQSTLATFTVKYYKAMDMMFMSNMNSTSKIELELGL